MPTLTVVSYDHGAGNYDNLPPPFRTEITKLTALPLWSFMFKTLIHMILIMLMSNENKCCGIVFIF